jgi:hypothetical protein
MKATANGSAMDRDVEAYRQVLPQLAQHEGKYVLIKSAEVRALHETYDAAMEAGYAKYGDAEFLVKEVRQADGPLLEALRQTCHT